MRRRHSIGLLAKTVSRASARDAKVKLREVTHECGSDC